MNRTGVHWISADISLSSVYFKSIFKTIFIKFFYQSEKKNENITNSYQSNVAGKTGGWINAKMTNCNFKRFSGQYIILTNVEVLVSLE